jgi:hypothetical protein
LAAICTGWLEMVDMLAEKFILEMVAPPALYLLNNGRVVCY